jgi:hypothetical protein
MGVMIAGLRIGKKALGPGRRPFDGPPEDLRSPDDRRNLDREFPFTPKPPPTSGEMTRILCSGMWSV